MRILIAFVLTLAVSLPLTAAAYPTLEAPAAYKGTAVNGNMAYKAFLRLQDGNFFVLHERITRSGTTVEEKSRTGTWRQLGAGAFLQLASRNGPSLRLNVGGGGNLYGDMRVGQLNTASVVFATAEDTPRPFNVYGLLAFEDDTATLRDSASNRVFTLMPDPRLAELAARHDTFFIQADVNEHGPALQLVQLYGASTRLPGQMAPSARLFNQTVTGGVWRLSAPGLPPLDCVFTATGEDKGIFEASGQGLRLRAGYVLGAGGASGEAHEVGTMGEKDERGEIAEAGDNAVSFQLSADDAPALYGAGHEALLRLLQSIRMWDTEGEVLVFSRHQMEGAAGAAGTALCVLEKTGEFRGPVTKRGTKQGTDRMTDRATAAAPGTQHKTTTGVTAPKPGTADKDQLTWTHWSFK